MRAVRVLIVLLALASLAGSCGPLGPLPGCSLSGEVVAETPASWAFTDEIEDVQLETRPGDPYSVTIWGVADGTAFYVASGKGGESSWAANIQADPHVRLRAGELVYELRAARVTDEAEIESVLAAMQRKYDFTPDADQRAKAWLFRLTPR